MRILARGNTGFVKELYKVGREQQYYVDNIKVYVARKEISVMVTEDASEVAYKFNCAREEATVVGGGQSCDLVFGLVPVFKKKDGGIRRVDKETRGVDGTGSDRQESGLGGMAATEKEVEMGDNDNGIL